MNCLCYTFQLLDGTIIYTVDKIIPLFLEEDILEYLPSGRYPGKDIIGGHNVHY